MDEWFNMPNKRRNKINTTQKLLTQSKNEEIHQMPSTYKMKVSVILDKLSQLFPQFTRTQLYNYVLDIVKEEKNNFCNITNSTIISTAVEAVLLSESETAMQMGEKVKPVAPFNSLQKECLICCAQLVAQQSIRLECGHMFHDMCVKRWFKEQSTCPSCRRHCLLDEDFPPLI